MNTSSKLERSFSSVCSLIDLDFENFQKILEKFFGMLNTHQKSSGNRGAWPTATICWFQGRFKLNFEMPNDQIHVLADCYCLT